MNKHILFVMRSLDNPKLFTQEERDANIRHAYETYLAADTDTREFFTAADATYAVDDKVTSELYTTEDWLVNYFKSSGEDRQEYTDEVNRLKEDKTMNKHILFVMRNLDNPELFTQEEKEANRKSAHAAQAAYTANTANTAYSATDWAASAAAAAADTAYDTDTEYWVNKFFERSGEDKQTYIDEVERLKEDKTMKDDKYNKTVTKSHGYKMILDVYDVLEAFEVTCPALQHLAKKALTVGNRGHKDTLTDLDDIIASALRAKELEIQRQFKKEG